MKKTINLKELFSQGYSSDQIAKILNKSEFSIIEKIENFKSNS